MPYKKSIATTIREYLNERQIFQSIDYNFLNKIFDNKIGELINFGKNSFVFEYESDKVIKIKNNNNLNYNDYYFYKTHKIGDFEFKRDVLNIDNKYLTVFDNKLYYVIMEKLKTDKDLYNNINDVEFSIKQFIKDIKKPPLLWLYENINNDSILIEFLEFLKLNIDSKNNYKLILDTLSDLIPLFIKMNEKNIKWKDIHSGNFGYNNKNELVPFDLEF
jgi:hypothetical protein